MSPSAHVTYPGYETLPYAMRSDDIDSRSTQGLNQVTLAAAVPQSQICRSATQQVTPQHMLWLLSSGCTYKVLLLAYLPHLPHRTIWTSPAI